MLHMRRFDVECSCCIGVCVMSQVFVLHMCLCHFGSVRVVYVYVTLSVCFVFIYESQREGESQVKWFISETPVGVHERTSIEIER